jgi:hypothetical protein
MARPVPLAEAEDKIDPDTYDKYIGVKVVLDDSTNGGGNLATELRNGYQWTPKWACTQQPNDGFKRI